MVGNAVRRIIDANPSLCISNNPMSTEPVNTTDVNGMQFDYPDCPASVDIAITITFVHAMFMVSSASAAMNMLMQSYKKLAISYACDTKVFAI